MILLLNVRRVPGKEPINTSDAGAPFNFLREDAYMKFLFSSLGAARALRSHFLQTAFVGMIAAGLFTAPTVSNAAAITVDVGLSLIAFLPGVSATWAGSPS